MGSNNSKKIEIRQLTENEIESILENTDYSRKEITDFYQNFSKIYPDGILYKDQFGKLYRELYPHKDCEQFLDQIFELFDSDKSGFVTFGEFLIAISLSGSKKPEEKLRLVFRMYDHNRNGYIDKKEIEGILESIAKTCDEITYEEIMNWDKDKNGQLSEEEFVKFILETGKLKRYYINLIKIHE